MRQIKEHHWLILIGLLAAAGLYSGWRLFWFMTDDAFIAFRYVSNSILGHGYVWNAPPFMPVEGYTSFLWVVLHDIIWRLTGLEPPAVANWLALTFSGLTLLVVGRAIMRMQLSRGLERYRLLLLALVLLATLTNRTFLAWTSSGLETALFNFTLSLWILTALRSEFRRPVQLWVLTISAALTYLTRPDGLLVLIATGLLIGSTLLGRVKDHKVEWRQWLALSPLLIPPVHLLWRHAFYGEWLPNTYYAKYVDAWPESGLRYLASFILEYGLWVWGLVALMALVRHWFRTDRGPEPVDSGLTLGRRLQNRLGPAAVICVLIVHVGYYTLVIGGDHFEYRVFSYLIPWAFVSFVWLLNRLTSDRIVAATAFGLFLLISWPLPWTHWSLSHDLNTRDDTHVMQVPIAEEFPAGVRWYAEVFDDLQNWLITHHVCMRHQEHKIFFEYNSSRYSGRSMPGDLWAGEYPIMEATTVGVPGWVFPEVSIIDLYGLNDYVIARHPIQRVRNRRMAHDRSAPAEHSFSFAINYSRTTGGGSRFVRRDYELTAEEIAANEAYWVDRIVHGNDVPMDYLARCRIGETYNRTADFDTAAQWFHGAIALDSNQARAWVGMAMSVAGRELYDSVPSLLQKAIELESDNPLLYSRLGVAAADIAYNDSAVGDRSPYEWFDSAESYLGKALVLDPCWNEALAEMSSIRAFLEDPDGSQLFFNRLVDCPEASPGVLLLLGERFRLLSYPELALNAYAAAIRKGLDKNQSQLLLQRYPELREKLRMEAGTSLRLD